jgi:hypothetical protein
MNFIKKNRILIISVVTIIAGVYAFFMVYPIEPKNETFIVMRKSAFKDSEKWAKDSCDIVKSVGEPDCSLIIDLAKIKPLTDIKVASFLKYHSKDICYDESYQYIENAHRVNYKEHIDTIIKFSKNSEKLSDLVYRIGTNTDYGNYINFTFDAISKKVIPNLKTSYKSGDVSLSAPAIMSIIKINTINPTKWTVKYSLYSKNSQIGLIISDNTKLKTYYYNYSTDPTKPSITMMNHKSFVKFLSN